MGPGPGRSGVSGRSLGRNLSGPGRYDELAPYYDRIYEGKEYREESAELLRIARSALGTRPRSLLDGGCGTGRHLAEFARSVPEVAGVDRSRPMLAIARRRLGRSVPLHVGDLRSFSVGRRFDLLTCLFGAIGYLPTERDRDRAMANFHRHLAPGGVALVEGWVRRSRWRGGHLHPVTYDAPELKLARLAVSRRRGNVSEIEFHHLIGERGRPIRHVSEVHRNPLLEPPERLRSFRRAGFRARVLLTGRYRDRGLYLGVRPPDGPPAPPARRPAGGDRPGTNRSLGPARSSHRREIPRTGRSAARTAGRSSRSRKTCTCAPASWV